MASLKATCQKGRPLLFVSKDGQFRLKLKLLFALIRKFSDKGEERQVHRDNDGTDRNA